VNLKYYISQFKAEVNYLPKNLAYFFSKKKKAIYIGCTGQGNLGDEAIFEAIHLMLKSNFNVYEISYAKPSAGKYLRRFLIKNPDYIILGGGTIIKKGSNESYLKILNDSVLRWPNANTAILGPGVSEPNFADFIGFPIDIEGWKAFLNIASFIAVRGVRSQERLKSWQIEKDVYIFHDPAVWFTKKDFKKKKKEKRIALNFADIGNRIFGKNQDLIKEFAIGIVNILQKNGWTIFLYPTTKTDMDYMLNSIGLKNFLEINIYRNYTNIEQSLSFLESMDVFVGQRLHSVIFSATVSTPFFALEYEPKTSDFLETIDMLDYKEQIDKLDIKTIFNKIKEIYLNIDYEQFNLNRKIVKAKEQQYKCLNKFLNNH
tara:strand:- start:47640 stop:48758 length:1119 start_codon:yes stop_codon:yes gene_type:complete